MPLIEFATFNELSTEFPALNSHEIAGRLRHLVETMKSARTLGFRRLRTRHDFLECIVGGISSIANGAALLPKDYRVLLFSCLQSPYLDVENEDSFLQKKIRCINDTIGRDAEGILAAILNDSPVVSLIGDPIWNAAYISAAVIDVSGSESMHSVPHATSPPHFFEHVRWSSRRTCSQIQLSPTRDHPLPNSAYSDKLVEGGWDRFREKLQGRPDEKIAQLFKMAEAVAHVNGYDYSSELSKKNGLHAIRQIFRSAFVVGRATLYLSTDFEKPSGAFEVCDFQGRHLGEWLFSGAQNGKPDDTGGHNIAV